MFAADFIVKRGGQGFPGIGQFDMGLILEEKVGLLVHRLLHLAGACVNILHDFYGAEDYANFIKEYPDG